MARVADKKVSAVTREVPVWSTAGGLTGFLDLDVWFGLRARVVVEVKKFDDQFEKQRAYVEDLRRADVETEFALLTTDFSEGIDVFGFRARNWKMFCLTARKLMPDVVRCSGNVVSALMLAFVGALEQNLLGLDARGVRKILSEQPDHASRTIDRPTLRYLHELFGEK